MEEHFLDDCLEQGIDQEESAKNLKPILNRVYFEYINLIH